MKRKLQIALSEEAWIIVDGLTTEANAEFKTGSISYSDVVTEMILSAKVDVKTLQAKHTNLRKSLRSLASQKDVDWDLAIKTLQDIKSKTSRKAAKQLSLSDEVVS